MNRAKIFYLSEIISHLNYISSTRHSTFAGSANVGNYLIFAGGGGNSSINTATVEAFTANLTKTTAPSLSKARYGLYGAGNGSYAVFGGGAVTDWQDAVNTVEAYNAQLVKSTPSALSGINYWGRGENVGQYVVLCAGNNGYSAAYNTSLTRTTLTTDRRRNLASNVNSAYAVFGGGTPGSSVSGMSDTIAAYNSNLTRTTATALSRARAYLASAKSGTNILFAGGGTNDWGGGSPVNTVDVYNESLVRTTTTTLSNINVSMTGASIDGYGIFMGGNSRNMSDMFDPNLVRTIIEPFYTQIGNSTSGVIGKYILFTTNSNNMEVYEKN